MLLMSCLLGGGGGVCGVVYTHVLTMYQEWIIIVYFIYNLKRFYQSRNLTINVAFPKKLDKGFKFAAKIAHIC